MTVARGRATNLGNDVFVAVVFEIGEGNAVSFVQLTRPGGSGDIHEILAVVIAKKHIRHQRAVGGVSGAQVNIQESVVINVAKVCTHRHKNFVESDLCGHVLEGSVLHVLVKLESRGVVRQPKIGTGRLLHGSRVAGHKQIRPAVVVVVEEPCGEPARVSLHASGFGDFRKRVVVVVVIEKTRPG